jgi:hypothetical protein
MTEYDGFVLLVIALGIIAIGFEVDKWLRNKKEDN